MTKGSDRYPNGDWGRSGKLMPIVNEDGSPAYERCVRRWEQHGDSVYIVDYYLYDGEWYCQIAAVRYNWSSVPMWTLIPSDDPSESDNFTELDAESKRVMRLCVPDGKLLTVSGGVYDDL